MSVKPAVLSAGMAPEMAERIIHNISQEVDRANADIQSVGPCLGC